MKNTQSVNVSAAHVLKGKFSFPECRFGPNALTLLRKCPISQYPAHRIGLRPFGCEGFFRSLGPSLIPISLLAEILTERISLEEKMLLKSRKARNGGAQLAKTISQRFDQRSVLDTFILDLLARNPCCCFCGRGSVE